MSLAMETAVTFRIGEETLRGVLHHRESGFKSARPTVLFLHGWSGCRLGPHRMFVHAARRFSALGFTCLRFDFRGRGDSDGATGAASIRAMIADTRAAVDFAAHEASAGGVILAGICSGAKVAIGAASADPRVQGLALWSAEVLAPLRGRATDRRRTLSVLHRYAVKLTQAATWRRLMSGRTNLAMVRKALRRDESPAEEEKANEAAILQRFGRYRGRTLFIYGTSDPDTGVAMERYRTFCAGASIRSDFHSISGANHNFSSSAWEQDVIRITENWLTAPDGQPPP